MPVTNQIFVVMAFTSFDENVFALAFCQRVWLRIIRSKIRSPSQTRMRMSIFANLPAAYRVRGLVLFTARDTTSAMISGELPFPCPYVFFIDMDTIFTKCPYGPLARRCLTILSLAASPKPVSITPGSTITTLIPNPATSSLRQSDQPSSACLVAWYQAPKRLYIFPPMEVILIMRPERLLLIAGSSNCVSRAAPNKLTSN